MKHQTMYLSAALAAALTVGSIMGCGDAKTSQQVPAEQAPVEQTELSQDEILAELKDAYQKASSYKSVTVAQHLVSNPADGNGQIKEPTADNKTYEENIIYKFDASGEKVKTSAAVDVEGSTVQYVTDGDAGTCTMDGVVYGGEAAEFPATFSGGVDSYLKQAIGDLPKVIECADTASKEQAGDIATYRLALNVEKYSQTSDILKILWESDAPIKGADLAISFDKDARVSGMELTTDYGESISVKTLSFSDYDSTTVEALPKATKTAEDLQKALAAKRGGGKAADTEEAK